MPAGGSCHLQRRCSGSGEKGILSNDANAWVGNNPTSGCAPALASSLRVSFYCVRCSSPRSALACHVHPKLWGRSRLLPASALHKYTKACSWHYSNSAVFWGQVTGGGAHRPVKVMHTLAHAAGAGWHMLLERAVTRN